MEESKEDFTIIGDNPVDIQALLAVATTITPIYPPTLGNTAYYGQFAMPATALRWPGLRG